MTRNCSNSIYSGFFLVPQDCPAVGYGKGRTVTKTCNNDITVSFSSKREEMSPCRMGTPRAGKYSEDSSSAVL